MKKYLAIYNLHFCHPLAESHSEDHGYLFLADSDEDAKTLAENFQKERNQGRERGEAKWKLTDLADVSPAKDLIGKAFTERKAAHNCQVPGNTFYRFF